MSTLRPASFLILPIVLVNGLFLRQASASNLPLSQEVRGEILTLVDNADQSERCHAIPMGPGGWVLTNLHCIEKSLRQLDLLRVERMRGEVSYLSLSLSQWPTSGVALPAVAFPDVPRLEGLGDRPAEVSLWAAGRGYPVIKSLGRQLLQNFTEAEQRQNEHDWMQAAAQFPLEDFALLRVQGLREDSSCPSFESATLDLGSEGDPIHISSPRNRSSGTMSVSAPRGGLGEVSYDLRWKPFWNYLRASGLIFSDLATGPGDSGSPIYDSKQRVGAMHSLSMSDPVWSAEIPIVRVFEALKKRFPELVGSKTECR